MHIEELVTKIQPLSGDIIKAAQKRFDNLIKPVGSLALLESMTARYAGILGSSDKQLVVIPENRLLLLWGEMKHAAEIETAMLKKKAVSVYASHVSAKVIPLLVIGESAYDLLEEGAMLTAEYIAEEQSGLICLGTFEKELRPDWQDLPEEEDGLAFLDRLQCPAVAAMTGAILQAAGMRVPVMLDGVATCLAALAASKFNPYVLQYCFAGDESAETVCRHVGEPENVGTDDFAPVLVNNARKRDPYAQDPVTWDPAPVRKFPQAAAQFPVPVQRIGKDHFLPYILQDFSLQVCQRHTDMVDRYVDPDRVGSIRFQTDPSGPASAGRLFTAALLQNPVPDHKIDIIDDRGHTQAQLRSYIRPGHFHPAPQQLQYICLALPFIL